MSLVRYKPIPSDRMAALWTMLSITDAVVLEYGPAGTTRFAQRHFEEMGLDTSRLLVTHLGEEDIIMGDISRLEKALIDVDKAYQPQVIFVVPSSVLVVTGSDTAGVCRYMQEQVSAQLITYEGGGFKGDYAIGLQDVYSLIVQSLTVPTAEITTNTYNLLGVSAHDPRSQANAREVERLMHFAFGAPKHASLGYDCTVSALQQAGRAAVNLVLRCEALPAAKWLQEHCGTPYVAPAPFGYSGTLEWLDSVSNVLGRIPERSFVKSIQQKQDCAVQTISNSLTKKGVTILGDYDTITGLSHFFKSLDIPCNAMICRHTLRHIVDPEELVDVYPAESDWLSALEHIHNQCVLGDQLALDLCPGDNTWICFDHGSSGADDEIWPLMGIRGADDIMANI